MESDKNWSKQNEAQLFEGSMPGEIRRKGTVFSRQLPLVTGDRYVDKFKTPSTEGPRTRLIFHLQGTQIPTFKKPRASRRSFQLQISGKKIFSVAVCLLVLTAQISSRCHSWMTPLFPRVMRRISLGTYISTVTGPLFLRILGLFLE